MATQTQDIPATVYDLTPDDQNARIHSPENLKAIGDSIELLGVGRGILIGKDNRIIAGNGTHAAAVHAGIQKVRIIDAERDEIIAVRRTDLTREEEIQMGILDNKAGEDSSWNLDMLAQLRDEGFDLTVAFDDSTLDAMLEDSLLNNAPPPKPEGEGGDDFDAEPADGPTVSRVGDVWTLGRHRLFCGDSGDPDVAATALMGTVPVLLWADPPYGINYISCRARSKMGGSSDPVAGDAAISVGWMDLYRFNRVYLCTRWDVASEWLEAIRARWSKVHTLIVWDKGLMSSGNLKSYGQRHEFIYFASNDKGEVTADKRPDNLWQVDGFANFTARTAEDSYGGHPMQKPVELAQRAMLHSTKAGDIVVDPFCGSGMSIIAGERADRIVIGIEIEPKFVDVALRRYEAETGQSPILAHRKVDSA